MQCFCGLHEFTDKPIFDPSLFVTIRKRISEKELNNNNNYVGNYGLSSNLLLEIKNKEEKINSKDRELADKDVLIESLKATIASKEEANEALKALVEALKK